MDISIWWWELKNYNESNNEQKKKNKTELCFLFRLEHTIGKQPPLSSEDRSKLTVLARMQRVENAINDMGQTMENIYGLLKNIDDRIDRLAINNNNTHQRSTRPIISNTGVKFSSAKEEIPWDWHI